MTPLLEVNLTIDAPTVTAFFVGLVALFSAYGAYQKRIDDQKAASAKVIADKAAAEAKTLAEDTKAVVDETHVLTNSGMTDIKNQLAIALADRDRLISENATLNAQAAAQTPVSPMPVEVVASADNPVSVEVVEKKGNT